MDECGFRGLLVLRGLRLGGGALESPESYAAAGEVYVGADPRRHTSQVVKRSFKALTREFTTGGEIAEIIGCKPDDFILRYEPILATQRPSSSPLARVY